MRPVAPIVVVYDGDCAFCCGQVARLRRMDRRGVFELVPRQHEGLDKRFPRLREGDFNTGMRVILPDGSIHVGADAVHQIARQLPVVGRLTWLYNVPGINALARGAYAVVARYRYRLSGRCDTGACEPPRRVD